MDGKERSKDREVPHRLEAKVFNRILLEAINEGLSTFGEAFRQVVLFHIGETFRFSEGDLPDKLDQFHQALSSILGSGSRIVEWEILNKLFLRLDLSVEPKRGFFEFTKEVEQAKKSVTLLQ